MDSQSAAATPRQLLATLPMGRFMKLGRVIGGGTLEARRISTGVQFYWRYTTEGKTDRLAIGPFDPSAPPKSLAKRDADAGYSLIAAMREAERLASQHRSAAEVGGLRAARAAVRKAQEVSGLQTLDRLLSDYCDLLESLGRTSHRDARSIFNTHVRGPWPDLANQPARSISTEHVADMMRRVLEEGKGRTANKLRSYLRAAFQTARAARTKASIPLHFKAYGVTVNPAADTEADESQNSPDKRPLSRQELLIYWGLIEHVDGLRGAVLRLHLLTGAQRIEQLVNLRTSAIGQASLTLLDAKGRPGRAARPHVVPLTKRAAADLSKCDPKGNFALSSDEGLTHIAATTLSGWATALAGKQILDFQAKRIRSGVETLLASLGVSQEIRGRLQSHGISGVQARHYDGHDYMKEKLGALKLLEEALCRRRK